MIKNIITKRKTEKCNVTIDVYNNSWKVSGVCWIAGEYDPVRMVGNVY